MSFFMRQRVEEDLERIRKANLPPKDGENEKEEKDPREYVDPNTGKVKKRRLKRSENGVDPLEKGDLAAMILAAFSIIGPYVLIFMGVMGIAVLLIWLFLG